MFDPNQDSNILDNSNNYLDSQAPWSEGLNTDSSDISGGNQYGMNTEDLNNLVFRGDSDNNDLNGNPGNDQIQGNKGDDLLNGGAGKDVLTGNLGNDSLVGGTDDDLLGGAKGNDGVNCGVTLLADTNRDGLVNNADQEGKQTWDKNHGAIFLPNLDDDGGKAKDAQVAPGIEGDKQLAQLNDANDSIVNGSEDAKDLAEIKIQPWSNAPDDTKVKLHTDTKSQPYVRMFLKKDGQYTALENDTTLQLSDLRNGASLTIEGKDIVRDKDVWDGFVDLTLEAKTGEQVHSDHVKLRVSPVMFQNNIMPVKELYATKYPDQATLDAQKQSIEQLVQETPNLDLSPEQQKVIDLFKSLQFSEADQQKSDKYQRDGHSDLVDDINTSLPSNAAPPNFRLLDASGDQWTQDIFEPGYASMPAADGGQQIMHIFYRSPSAGVSPEDLINKKENANVFLREGGSSVFTELAGKDIGGVQQFSESWAKDPSKVTQNTYNSTGNFEAIPPHQFNGKNYPVGRMIFGSAEGNQPDPSFVKMLESQGYQDPITVDSSWLSVGHVDEFINFVPANNERGWTMAIASPDQAFGILRDAQLKGNGNTELFSGKETVQPGENGAKLVPATTTVDSLLADDSVKKANEFAQQKINEAVEKIKAQTGISDQEIIKLPVLYKTEELGISTSQIGVTTSATEKSIKVRAFVPGSINGMVVNDQYLAPKQHGPVVDSVDLFEKDIEDKLSPGGSQVKWIEDWYYAHEPGGEVHCVTNTLRDPSQSDPWWQENA